MGIFDPADDFFAEAKVLVGIFDPAGFAVALGVRRGWGFFDFDLECTHKLQR